MKVLLVNPPNASQGGFSSAPLGLLYLAASLEKDGHDVSLCDGYLDGFDGVDRALEQKPDLVGVTCYTPGRHQALEVCRRAKVAGAITVMGGPHPTIMWAQLLTHYRDIVDICVLGEGEQTIRDIAGGGFGHSVPGIAFRSPSGEIVRTARREYIANLDDIPFPAWHLCAIDRYPGGGGVMDIRGHSVSLGQVRVPLIMSRGCTGQCTFCSSWWCWRGYRSRSGANVADEVEMLVNRGYHHFVLEDDAMSLNRQTVMDFCSEVIGRDLPIAFFCTTRADAFDLEMGQALKAAGAYGISYGIESGSQRILDQMNKHTTVAQNEAAIHAAREAGLSVCALMMVGSPGETDETINESVAFLQRTNPEDVGTLGQTWVMPGTALYQYARRKGYIDDSYWLTQNEVFVLQDGFTMDDLAQWHNHLCARQFV